MKIAMLAQNADLYSHQRMKEAAEARGGREVGRSFPDARPAGAGADQNASALPPALFLAKLGGR